MPSPPITGVRASVNAWPGTPSEIPMISSLTTSACIAATVPPMTNALTFLIVGDAL